MYLHISKNMMSYNSCTYVQGNRSQNSSGDGAAEWLQVRKCK